MTPKSFRVIPIQNLGGSDMECTVFVESNQENDPEIDKLAKVVELLDGSTAHGLESTRFSEQHIMDFFNNPLSKVYGAGIYKGHYDHEGTYILRGRIIFPPNILKDDNKSQKSLIKRWENSVLRCTKFPEWKNICETVEEIGSYNE